MKIKHLFLIAAFAASFAACNDEKDDDKAAATCRQSTISAAA